MKFFRPIEFELPDEWWIKSGMSGFQPTTSSYISTTSSQWPIAVVHLSEIRPPRRNDGAEQFREADMTRVLEGFVSGAIIPPIVVHELPESNGFRYGVRDGFHRFHASAAAGFEYIPVEILPYFDIRTGR
jgi:hypothetical protein